MAKDRQHDRQAGKHRHRADDQQDGDDQPPGGHRDRVDQDRAHRGVDGLIGADVAVEQKRERDDGGGEHERRKDEADGVAKDDQRPAARRGENSLRKPVIESGGAGPNSCW